MPVAVPAHVPLLFQVDPSTNTIAVDDFCLDGDLELVQCHDLEPFYPVMPYHSHNFMCFDGVAHHASEAVCVAPKDMTKERAGALALGRLPAFHNSLWPEEEARRANAADKLVANAQSTLAEQANDAKAMPFTSKLVAVGLTGAASLLIAIYRRASSLHTSAVEVGSSELL